MITTYLIGTEISGRKFNRICAGITFVKLTNTTENHFNFKYKED